MEQEDVETTVRSYYEALRRGKPLAPYFAEEESVIKVGISERLTGYEAVAAALRDQTRNTTGWTVRSTDLRVTERDRHAWFGDAVRLEWTNTEDGTRHAFDSRWSGTLEDRNGWVFVGMHVSVPRDL